MSKPTRDLVKIVFQTFFKSFKPRQTRGNYMGEDYFGNKYFEIPANPSIGKRKPSRWFEPSDKEAFDEEMTAEWEAWLRFRRQEPPTKDELVRNLQIIEMKKRNASKLEEIHGTSEERKTKGEIGYESFPKYSEYESIPGKDPTKKQY